MNIVEQELAAVERQCAEAMMAVGAGTANVAVVFCYRFLWASRS